MSMMIVHNITSKFYEGTEKLIIGRLTLTWQMKLWNHKSAAIPVSQLAAIRDSTVLSSTTGSQL